MTTNVYDRGAIHLATDSRWSFRVDDYAVCYVDDTGFDKLFIDQHANFAASFAGNSELISDWKDYLGTTMAGPWPEVYRNGVAICICLVDRLGNVVFQENQDIHHDDGSVFAGSGALSAYTCWKSNKSATRAVDSAKMIDIFSGGEVKLVEVATGKHNVQNSTPLAGVAQSFLQKGFVMYTKSSPTPIPFDQAAANDAKLGEIKNKLVSGEVQISAPYDRMYQDWSDEKKTQLGAAIASLRQNYR